MKPHEPKPKDYLLARNSRFTTALILLVEKQMRGHRMNVTDVAKAAGIQRSGLSAWLHGRRPMCHENIAAVMDAMNIVPTISLQRAEET